MFKKPEGKTDLFEKLKAIPIADLLKVIERRKQEEQGLDDELGAEMGLEGEEEVDPFAEEEEDEEGMFAVTPK
jgi:hypothetical protein